MSTATATEIYLYEDIEPGLDISFAQSLDDLRGADEVLVRINSDGGSVTVGMAIYNAILRARGRGQIVDTVVDGGAFSIAAVIAQSGRRRYVTRSSLTMLHLPWTTRGGNAEELRKNADMLEKVGEQLIDLFTTRTRQDRSQVKKWLSEETWFDASEAVIAGLADEIVTDVYGADMGEILAKYKVPTKYRNALRAPVEKLLDDVNICGRIARKTDSYEVFCSFRRQAVDAAAKLLETPGHTPDDIARAADVVKMLAAQEDMPRRMY